MGRQGDIMNAKQWIAALVLLGLLGATGCQSFFEAPCLTDRAPCKRIPINR